ncbi:MAG: hypothetical protein J3Q66DRAFT_326929 [Benniella sp.]|nr:MAG: hypothetical protein J3Q66DRAFT_326929 [Benniella sp.]
MVNNHVWHCTLLFHSLFLNCTRMCVMMVQGLTKMTDPDGISFLLVFFFFVLVFFSVTKSSHSAIPHNRPREPALLVEKIPYKKNTGSEIRTPPDPIEMPPMSPKGPVMPVKTNALTG